MSPRDEGSADAATLPSNAEAERSVLGAILADNAVLDAVGGLTADDFHARRHKVLFAALVRMAGEHTAADLVTVREELTRVGALEDAGGIAYIAGLVDGMPRSVNVGHYARIVRDKAKLRAIIFAANRLLRDAYAAEESADTIIAKADRTIVDLAARPGAGMPTRTNGIDLLNDLQYRVEHRGELTGIDTGFPVLNELTLGWQRGDLIILGAPSSVGKTTFAMGTAVAAAQAGHRVLFFSLEMSRRQLEYRILSMLSKVPLSRILSGYIAPREMTTTAHAVEELVRLPLIIDDRGGLTVWDIRSACRLAKTDGPLDLVVIDYVQLVAGSLDRKGATRYDEVTDISRRVKALARDLHAPVILLSQLNRAGSKRTDPRPKLEDLRDSGRLGEDADIVAFLHRKSHREGGKTSLILEKQRMGPTGAVALELDRDVVTFRAVSDEPIDDAAEALEDVAADVAARFIPPVDNPMRPGPRGRRRSDDPGWWKKKPALPGMDSE